MSTPTERADAQRVLNVPTIPRCPKCGKQRVLFQGLCGKCGDEEGQ